MAHPHEAKQAEAQRQADQTGEIWVVIARHVHAGGPLWEVCRQADVRPGFLKGDDTLWSRHYPTP